MKRFNLLIILALFASFCFGASSGKRQTTSILSLSNDANGCFEDQTIGSATTINLNGALASGNVCTFSSAQQISIEGASNESGVVVVIVGTDADGRRETESLTLANAGTAKSVRWYKTIITITTDGSTTGNIEGGPLSTNGAVSKSLVPDLAGFTSIMSIAVSSCTCTYTVEHTSYNTPSTIEQVWFDTVGMVAKTADSEGNIVAPVAGVRAKITAYTSGSLDITILQANNR